jgi:tetratricopeptide (TPR) repeat protein
VKVIAISVTGTGGPGGTAAADAHVLADAHINLGLLYHQTGRLPQAAQEYEQAEALLERLWRDAPLDYAVAYSLGALHANAGNLLKDRQQPEAALAKYAQAIALATQVLRQEPQFAQARRVLINGHGARALLLSQLGRYREAVLDWERVVALVPPEGRNYQRLHLAEALVRAGDHARAVAEAESLSAVMPANANWQEFYHLATVCSLAVAQVRDARTLPALGASTTGLLGVPCGPTALLMAGTAFPGRTDATQLPPAERDRRAERYAAQAVELLGKARTSLGEEKWRAKVPEVRAEADFQPLGQRADFQRLLRDGRPSSD